MSLLSFTRGLRAKARRAQVAREKPAAGQERVTAPAAEHAAGFFLQPLLTEKSVREHEQGTAVFRVPSFVSKQQVARAVRQRYAVTVRRVRTVRMLPRQRRRGSTYGWTAAWKKAYVEVDDIHKVAGGP